MGTRVPFSLHRGVRSSRRLQLDESGRDDLTLAPMSVVARERLSAVVPPQNLEAEESVLGAMLLSATAVGTVSEILAASDLYRESHAKIYRAILALWGKGEPVDAITLADELDERGEIDDIGGQARIAELA